jgi:crotonobetainyl-CoA:carnitine CoA-transferase CaiB-like acyl-CoA transferase
MGAIRHPLAGLKVVEAADDIGGEFTGLLLAQMGAEVTKLEPPEGSPTRRVGPFAKNRIIDLSYTAAAKLDIAGKRAAAAARST